MMFIINLIVNIILIISLTWSRYRIYLRRCVTGRQGILSSSYQAPCLGSPTLRLTQISDFSGGKNLRFSSNIILSQTQLSLWIFSKISAEMRPSFRFIILLAAWSLNWFHIRYVRGIHVCSSLEKTVNLDDLNKPIYEWIGGGDLFFFTFNYWH
jgi:hypothetical protein